MGWIGVDLDGTLAHYTDWVAVDSIGAPIPAMVQRVKAWRKEGMDVRIFTARISRKFMPIVILPELNKAEQEYVIAKKAIEHWCLRHLGEILPITCIKDFEMLELWDDRAVQVISNTGNPVGESTRGLV